MTMLKRASYSTILPFAPSSSQQQQYYTPLQLSAIYGLNTSPLNTSVSTNIVIIELGGKYNTNDLNSYWKYLGLQTIPKVQAVYLDGYSPSSVQSNDSANIEVMMDIEIIGAIFPNSNIYVIFAPNSEKGFIDAINYVVKKNIFSTMSISWGAPENAWSNNGKQQMNSSLQKAALLGITVCVAAGDNGATDGESGSLNVDFPASSPYVLSCGGTSLYCPSYTYNSNTTQEVVWNNANGAATGGGYSSVFSQPSYQTPYITASTYRAVPDVSANADPVYGYIILANSKYRIVGGTSAVAPLYAAYLAYIQSSSNKKKQWMVPLLYQAKKQNPASFHPVTTGNNGYYSANSNFWSPCTGLGSPNGSTLTTTLLSLLASSSIKLVKTISSSSYSRNKN